MPLLPSRSTGKAPHRAQGAPPTQQAPRQQGRTYVCPTLPPAPSSVRGHTFEAAPVATLLEAEVLFKFATVIGGNYVEQGHDGLLVC